MGTKKSATLQLAGHEGRRGEGRRGEGRGGEGRGGEERGGEGRNLSVTDKIEH